MMVTIVYASFWCFFLPRSCHSPTTMMSQSCHNFISLESFSSLNTRRETKDGMAQDKVNQVGRTRIHHLLGYVSSLFHRDLCYIFVCHVVEDSGTSALASAFASELPLSTMQCAQGLKTGEWQLTAGLPAPSPQRGHNKLKHETGVTRENRDMILRPIKRHTNSHVP